MSTMLVKRASAALTSRTALVAPLRPAAARRVATSRRGVVAVQANLFIRIFRVAKSVPNNVVTKAEDPEKLLDTVVMEMQEDLQKMRQAAAQVMATQQQLDIKFRQFQGAADEWLRRAELAVARGEDGLAREALRRRKANQEQADALKTQLQFQQKAIDTLAANCRTMEGKLSEARNKKDTLKARAAGAKMSKQIQEMLSSLNQSNATVAFQKLEEKVMAMEAEVEGLELLAGNDKLETQFALLESGTVEDELSALKKGLLKAPAAAPAVPQGRLFQNVIDIELEVLRGRAMAMS